MDIATIITAIKNLWVNNSALQAWCVDQYAKKPAIFIGIDHLKPPNSADYPVIVLYSIRDVSEGTKIKSYQIDFGVGITDQTTETDATDKTTEYSGLSAVATFMRMAEDAVREGRLGKILFEHEILPVTVYPEHVCHSQMTLEMINSD